jgi:Tol biopolymer transport system component
MRRFVGITMVLTVGVAMMVATPARAAFLGENFPGTNGRIVFARAVCRGTSCRKFRWRIVAADANDANETVLAGPYPGDAFDEHFIANWSPDGTTVVFMVNRGIWQVNDDGTGLHEVFHARRGTGVDDGPTFTPDGQHIVFPICCPGRAGQSLWMIDVDGTGLTQVTKERRGWGEGSPQVSPDGKRVAFNRCGDPCQVATASIKTGNIRQLTHKRKSASEHPNWSPNSNKIVFHIHYSSGSGDIAIMNADGSHVKRLSSNGPRGRTGSYDPCFSPDGTTVLFDRYPLPKGSELFSVSRTGGESTRVTRTASEGELYPQWAVA